MGQQGWMLVVDDDAARRMTLFRLLEREGHRATVANDGKGAGPCRSVPLGPTPNERRCGCLKFRISGTEPAGR